MKFLALLLMVVYTPETVPTEEVGTYYVEVSDNDGLTTVISWTIVDETTTRYGNILFDAKDFYVTDENKISEEFIIENSNYKVWDEDSLEEFDVVDVVFYKVEDDLYTAELFTINNYSVKINIHVVSEEEYKEIMGLGLYNDEEIVYDDQELGLFKYSKYIKNVLLVVIYVLVLYVIMTIRKYNKEFLKVFYSYKEAKYVSKK